MHPEMRLPITTLVGSKLQILHLKMKEASSKGQWQEVLSHYHEIRNIEILPSDNITASTNLFPLIFKACTKLQCLNKAASVQARVIKHGLESITSIGNSIVDFYMKRGSVNSAMGAFTSISYKDSVSWNVVIHGHLEQGAPEEGLRLFMEARIADFEPNMSTFVLVLKACRDIRAIHEGMIIHGFIIQIGFMAIASVLNSLLSFYVESGYVKCAQMLFDEMPRDVISWSVMIGGYVKSEEGEVALKLFRDMSSVARIEPDEITVTSVIKACTNMRDVEVGRLVHGYVICRGLISDAFVSNSLIDMYSKCSDANSAFKVFDEMPQRNMVSWNSILSGFVHNEWYVEALRLYGSMVNAGNEGDEVTIVNLLHICKTFRQAIQCKSIHCWVLRRGIESNELVVNSLIDAYSKCNQTESSWALFTRMEQRDLITWSTMIAAFSQSGKPDKAISLFCKMVQLQGNFNVVTVLSLLEACSVSAELRRSKWAHGLAIRTGLSEEVAIGTALLDMYSKCGAIGTSRNVFDQMPDRNVVSWSAMIAAYGMNGQAHDALALLAKMESQDLTPNAVTMLSVLSACSHGGLVAEGISCFEKMIQDYGLEAGSEHYSCLVDMLGRAGKLNGAMELITKIPERVKIGPSVWGSLLSACRSCGDSIIGEQAASHVLEMERSSSAGYLLASTIYAATGEWSEAARMRRLVKEKGVRLIAGYSLVHLKNKTYRFLAGDYSHPEFEEIKVVVEQLHGCMKMNMSSYMR